jgi:hypothetical protein
LLNTEHHASQFETAIKDKEVDAMMLSIMINLLTKLWRILSTSLVLEKYFGEWLKVAKIATMQLLNSTRDDRIFSIINFTMFNICKSLSELLQSILGMIGHSFFDLFI